MNSKNDNAKKDLRLLYSQGNKTAYPATAKSMARYLLTQYNNKVLNNPRNKRGDRNSKKGDDGYLKSAILPLQGLLARTLGKAQHLKIQPLLAKGLVLVIPSLKSHNQHFVWLDQ